MIGQNGSADNKSHEPNNGLSPVSEAHRAFLNGQAITDEVIEEFGVRSVTADEAIKLGFSSFFVKSDGILFWWTQPDGTKVPQFRPDEPVDGDHKYLFVKDGGAGVGIFREPADGCPWLFPEGTKQSLAVASYAPDGWGVAGTPGCRAWYGTDMRWTAGHEIVAMFDADTSHNSDVWDAATELKDAADFRGATGVVFARMPGTGSKDGMDDILSREPEDGRTALIELLRRRATPDLGRRPKQKAPKPAPVDPPDTGGRVGVAVNIDRRAVIEDITKALKDKWDGKILFDYGGAITRRNGAELEPLEKGKFLNALVDVAACFRYTEATATKPATFEDAWPDALTVEAVLSRAQQYTPITRIVRAPFVRQDGTVCATGGYDAASKTWLELDDGLSVTVPAEPSADEIAAAVKLLTVDLLGDFPFSEDSDRAGALALMITPFVRDRIDLAPLAVVDGLQMGVGKNLFADVVSILLTGAAAITQSLPDSNEEVRKQITATLRSGHSLIVFDEAHELKGRALAQALTTEYWQDRILGVTQNVLLPNVATWMSLGNNVSVEGDIARRVYWVRLHPTYANPQDRPASSFRHADLKEWAAEHRAELLSAVLTLVRAWYAAGCPFTPGKDSFGSFTRWEKTVGGILQTAGVSGFLGGLRTKRSESDWTGAQWAEHFAWLLHAFGSEDFATAEVRNKSFDVRATSGLPFAAPPGLEDTSPKDWSRKLGYAYRGVLNQIRGGMRLVKSGTGHGHVTKYVIQVVDETESTSSGGDGGDKGDHSSLHVEKKCSTEPAVKHTPVKGGAETSPPSPPSPPSPNGLGPAPCTCDPANPFVTEDWHEPECARRTEAVS
ncbi:hypothetical protein [Streptomyces olivochromogenes]|uniref:hypothetical protein n=1 Tax=Streptomyces olivochromogenes TaxID=1963 RepID=UPI00368F9345